MGALDEPAGGLGIAGWLGLTLGPRLTIGPREPLAKDVLVAILGALCAAAVATLWLWLIGAATEAWGTGDAAVAKTAAGGICRVGSTGLDAWGGVGAASAPDGATSWVGPPPVSSRTARAPMLSAAATRPSFSARWTRRPRAV